ncbi:MAG: hypothetical protein NW207_03645 [Cytophagales bacterium]|nr:hypothetical protein [Cytophagales bacterium]
MNRHIQTILYIFITFLTNIFIANAQFIDTWHTTACNIDMTVNNLGVTGNSFRGEYQTEGWGSLRFPASSKVEHMFLAGLWVGGFVNGQARVSTSAIGTPQGYATGTSGYEFTAPIGSKLSIKSNLLDNQYYDPSAISHEDIIGYFTDSNVVAPGTSLFINNHTNPLKFGGRVRFMNWNFSSANFFVAIDFQIINTGDNVIDSLYIGYWTDFVIRNVSIYPPGGTPFYAAGGNEYIDTLNLAYEWDGETSTSIPNAQSYSGVKFLGAYDKFGKRNTKYTKVFNGNQLVSVDGANILGYTNSTINGLTYRNIRTHFNTWLFNSSDPNYFTPRNDNDYFARMRKGLNFQSNWATTVRNTLRNGGNRSNIISIGPFPKFEPRDTINITFAIVCGSPVNDGQPYNKDTPKQRSEFINNARLAQKAYDGEDLNGNGLMDAGEDKNKNGKLDGWIFPTPPDAPKLKVLTSDNKIEVYWSNNADNSIDPSSNIKDFEGYRIYKTQVGFDVQGESNIVKSLKQIAAYDHAGNYLFYDTGLDAIKLPSPVKFEGDTTHYYYKYTFDNVPNGWQHAIAVTSFDTGDTLQGVPSLESSPLQSLRRVFAGTPENNSITTKDPFVYPNPYYGLAAWEGGSKYEEDRKLIFANLPKRSRIKVFTVSGDLVDDFEHNTGYTGSDIRWYGTYSNSKETVFPGGEHAWDLLSKDSQLLARGVYLFSVEDLDSGQSFAGKFIIIK